MQISSASWISIHTLSRSCTLTRIPAPRPHLHSKTSKNLPSGSQRPFASPAAKSTESRPRVRVASPPRPRPTTRTAKSTPGSKVAAEAHSIGSITKCAFATPIRSSCAIRAVMGFCYRRKISFPPGKRPLMPSCILEDI